MYPYVPYHNLHLCKKTPNIMNVACWVVLRCCSRVIDIMRTLILHRLRHFYHAKPDGLQVPCQMPYYIYKHHLEHQAIYGHDLDQPTGSNDTGVCRSVCCLHCADITYSEWALCIPR